MKRFIGNKAFYLKTISISLPIMAQQFVTSFVNLIDNIMIGNVGSLALTSVTVANRIYLIFNSTLFGISGAAGIFIAQYFGAKNIKKCQQILNLNILIALIISILFVTSLIFIPGYLVSFFTSEPDIMNESLKYFQYALFAYIPYSFSFTVMMALRAVGINKIQLLVGALTVLTNTTLNYILIFGNFGFPELGVQGAAIATSIARFLEMLIYAFLLIRKRHLFQLQIKQWFIIQWDLVKSLTRKAIPLTMNEILFSTGMAMVFISYMRCDSSLISATSVVDTSMQIAFIVFSGLSSAVAILIGNRLGANQIEEAKDNANKLIAFGMAVGVVIGLIFIGLAPVIASFYNVGDEIKSTIVSLLTIKSCLLPFYVYNVCVFFTLRAGGDALSTLIMDSGFLWCVNVTVSTILSIFFNIPLVIMYMMVESLDILKLFIATYFYRKGKWARNMTVDM